MYTLIWFTSAGYLARNWDGSFFFRFNDGHTVPVFEADAIELINEAVIYEMGGM